MSRIFKHAKPYEFEQILGASKGQGSLACCSPQGRRVGRNLVTEQQEKPQHSLWKQEKELGPVDPTPDSRLMGGMLVIPC